MASYMQVTSELLAGLYEDLERLQPEAPGRKTDAGARRNLLRCILNGDPSEHVRVSQLPEDRQAEEQQAIATRLRQAERLLFRAKPLIVEGGRFVTTESVTYAVEQFLKSAYREGEA